MTLMPRPNLPHLWRTRPRPGVIAWYVCRGPGHRKIRIRGEYGSPEFQRAYEAALADHPIPMSSGKAIPHSLAWLIEQYRESSEWRGLSNATRRNRENHFRSIATLSGNIPHRNIRTRDIIAGRDRRGDTPAQARNFLDALRGLFRWAKMAGHRSDDPTAGVENPKRRKGPGFPIWTEDDVESFYRRWPVGTRERVWIDVLLFTGGRRGDAVRIGRQHVRAGIATFRTEKSQQQVEVSIPILPVLQRTLDAGPTGELAWICGKAGKPFTKESFGNAFKDACIHAGVIGKSAHGIRKIAATRAAEAGASISELNAIFGWSGSSMASLYTQAADRKHLAARAIKKLTGERN